jgi:hypothetical protein
MTQHPLQEHIEDDKRIMRRLFMVVGVFVVASAAMAVVIAVVFA